MFSLATMAFCFVMSARSRITPEKCADLGLPVLFIETARAKSPRKDKYVKAVCSLGGEGGACKVRGHGNTTWNSMFKKPYLLKLDDAAPLCGMPAARKWILLANMADCAVVRNAYAFHLAADVFDRSACAPKSAFVSLFLNGKYNGLYQLAEKIEFAQNRLARFNGGPMSFVAEVNSRMDRERSFETARGSAFSIRSPKADAARCAQFQSAIERAEREICARQPAGEVRARSSWLGSLDIGSFVDWYIVNEFMKNHDARFQNSCFMVYDSRAQKFFMGPVWDFDLSCGNISWHTEEPEGFWVNTRGWYKEFFCDKEFTDALAKRWREKRDELLDSLAWIQKTADALSPAVSMDQSVWPSFGRFRWPYPRGWRKRKTYQEEVDFLVDFLRERFEWMDGAIAGL